uniref:Uncharacterized protein n=1 Tax=Aegilops tauschii subsp. strangulata TaxID=200361 RepID=A0A453NE88_AEGTS
DFTTVGAANLRSLTVVDCSRTTELRVPAAPRLRSFRFSGPFLCSNLFSGVGDSFQDLYLCSGGPEAGLPPTNLPSAVPHLANITTLTICSIALQVRLWHPFHFLVKHFPLAMRLYFVLPLPLVRVCVTGHHPQGDQSPQVEGASIAHVRDGQLQSRRHF